MAVMPGGSWMMGGGPPPQGPAGYGVPPPGMATGPSGEVLMSVGGAVGPPGVPPGYYYPGSPPMPMGVTPGAHPHQALPSHPSAAAHHHGAMGGSMGAPPPGVPQSSGYMPASQTVAAAAATLAAVSTADPQSSKGTGLGRAKDSSVGGVKDGSINPTSQSTGVKDVGAKRPLAESLRPGSGAPRSVRQRVD
eukprot:TRINITY_DN4962_c0_g1_i1.p4 TRINITY_DN4962_c0_g1~~TRINITY_DN4962_c0_g1_i1.p4  ORF type:complete len:192 (+),score=44.62 TRINITY_DN4962_c0_g1_i1:912-1487(+)